MEFLPMQDKDVAFRIFELGMKRFGDNPDFLLAYIDHTSHLNGKHAKQFYSYCCLLHLLLTLLLLFLLHLLLTLLFLLRHCHLLYLLLILLSFILLEDNNTRVLFEKVLSMLPTEQSR